VKTSICWLCIPFLLLIGGAAPARADEGMWTFDNFPKQKVRATYGFDPTDEWLEQVRLSAVRLASGCSGSFVSADGLVLTNHHCVYECLQQISTADKDFTRSGFPAPTGGEEVQCGEIEINQLVGIEDVTAKLREVTRGKSGKEFAEAQREAMNRMETACAEGDRFVCEVVTLYHGGRYGLYKYRTYRDVRLVFAGETQAAYFGGDPDNFNFPRYCFDAAFLRVYEDGKPAATPAHFRWNAAGPKDGDLVFVPGNPGGTDRLLTVAQLEYLRDVRYPAAFLRLAELRGLLTQFAKQDANARRISQDMLLYIENGLKAMRGEYATLTDRSFMNRRSKEEEGLRERIAKIPERRKTYGGAWQAIAQAQGSKRRLGVSYTAIESRYGFASTLFRHARTLVRAAEELPKPNAARLREFSDGALPSLKQALFSAAPIEPPLEMLLLEHSLAKLREHLGADDPFVRKVLGKESPENLARSLVTGTRLADVAVRKALWEGGRKAVEASDDPLIRLARLVDPDARAVRAAWESEVEAPETKNAELIAQAWFDDQGTGTYPDGTFTPRLAFGTVKGWQERDRTIAPFTTFAGLFDRVTGQDPYALPDRWMQAQSKLNPATPMNFVGDIDITGGNSGSPIVSRDRAVVGLLFDGNIHSLGGNFWFDPALNRAVAVHPAAITEALRVVYGAGRLVEELTNGGIAPAR
jgi:hypothetical protein